MKWALLSGLHKLFIMDWINRQPEFHYLFSCLFSKKSYLRWGINLDFLSTSKYFFTALWQFVKVVGKLKYLIFLYFVFKFFFQALHVIPQSHFR